MSGWDSDALPSENSFPSLDNIYEEEEDSYISPSKLNRANPQQFSPEVQQKKLTQTQCADRNIISDLYAQTELCRPFNDDIREVEVSQSDVTHPTQNRRRKFLELVRVCLSKDMTRDSASTNSGPKCVQPNCANAASSGSNTNNKDISSFVDVADLPTSHFGVNLMNENTDDDSTYNLYASTLSRASASTKTSTIGDAIGDRILQESKIAAEMTRARARARAAGQSSSLYKTGEVCEDSDNQTLSTYSYKRAYVDNLTLGSALTSNFSTITDEYSHDTQRRIGLGDAVRPEIFINQTSLAGPIDMDTGKAMEVKKDEDSASSYPMPPPIFRINTNASHFNPRSTNNDSYNLQGVVSSGGGEGFVDDEAAERFESLRRSDGGGNDSGSGCCIWFSSVSRVVRLILVTSFMLLLVSIVSVSIGILLQKNENIGFVASSNAVAGNSGAQNINIMQTLSPFPSVAPTATKQIELPSSVPTRRSSTTPSAPSTTTPSFMVQTAQPIASTSPTITPSETSTTEPTSQPSTSPVAPTSKPTKKPISTASPTQIPSKNPTPKPSFSPTSPSAKPIVEPIPTFNPSPRPSRSPTPPPSRAPTSPAPVYSHPSLSYSIKIRAAQDTYIDGSSVTSMWMNFGTSHRLRVDGSPQRRTFIGFDTSRLKTRVERHDSHPGNDEPRRLAEMQVLEARLRLYSIDDGGGGTVYFLPNTKKWKETEVTGTSLGDGVNASGGYKIGSFDDVEEYKWIEIDVTEAFTSGIRDFTTIAVTSDSSDGVSFASKERASGVFAPEIVLIIAGSTTSAPSPGGGWPTYSPTAIQSEDPSPKPSRKPTRKVRPKLSRLTLFASAPRILTL